MTLHINLGSGNDYKQGFINIDIANTKADIVGRMEDFVPKEIVRYVEARWSFSFLDESKAMLDKVLFWLIFGGELQFRERDSIRIENFITLGSMGREDHPTCRWMNPCSLHGTM